MSRQKTIIRTSIVGILANLVLAGGKAVFGLLSRSIAIVLDAVNNLTDALSSVVTIIGAKIAGKAPDRKHPLGHGRVEYVTTMVISAIILYAGVTSLVESIKKIITPEAPDYSTLTLVMIGAAVAVKVVLGLFVRNTGKRVKSDVLVASGRDALFDAVISLSTLVAAVLFVTIHVSLEAWLGALIALYIIKAGIDIFREALSEILGKRTDPDITKRVREAFLEFPEVSGVFDLVIHNYGPEMLVGSAHVAVPGNMTAEELDSLERHIAEKVHAKTGVIITGVSIYAVSDRDLPKKTESEIRTMLDDYPEVLELHGFRLDEEEKRLRFDIIIDFDVKHREEIYREIVEKVQAAYPDYQVSVTLDMDISD